MRWHGVGMVWKLLGTWSCARGEGWLSPFPVGFLASSLSQLCPVIPTSLCVSELGSIIPMLNSSMVLSEVEVSERCFPLRYAEEFGAPYLHPVPSP